LRALAKKIAFGLKNLAGVPKTYGHSAIPAGCWNKPEQAGFSTILNLNLRLHAR
jgi:hypothetical protein